MTIQLPYYSQQRDVGDPEWKDRACGVVCLKMVLDGLLRARVSVSELIGRGLEIGGYDFDIGWRHDGLVSLAKEYGLEMTRREYKSADAREKEILFRQGVSDIVRSLAEKKPVLVSVLKRFRDTGGFHIVVLVGLKTDEGVLKGFYYHDSDTRAGEAGEGLFVDMDTFEKRWRRLAIFVK